MKSSIRYKINRLIAVTVISITVILMGISMMVVNKYSQTAANTMLKDTLDAQALRLNSRQKSIEQAVASIYEISKYALEDYENISSLNNPESIDAYLNLFRSTAISIAKNTDGGCAVYFRFSPNVAGDGKQGFFYVKNNRTGKFESNEVTDILAYDENDAEHVGWYYIPMKMKKGAWLSPYFNANLGFDMISYVIPIFDGSTPVGVVGIDVDFRTMLSITEDVDIYESCGANLIGTDLNTVYYERCKLMGDKLDEKLSAAIADTYESAQMIPFSINNEGYKFMFTTLNNGMKIILYAKDADIYSVGVMLVKTGIVIFIGVFLVALFIAIRFSDRITRPIVAINTATKEYAKGNWDVNLSCDTDDELKELADSITEMAQNTKEYIRNLQDALVVAEEASKAKSTFLSNVSHDIRTPMNAIIAYSQFAVSQPELSEKTFSYLSHILQASNHLLSLINSVLEMSRIESGKTQINLVPCNIRELVEELNAFMYANSSEKNQIITIDTKGIKNENIMCDSLRFNQVMINLAGNAVKFTPEGGSITIIASEDVIKTPGESLYHFVVRDSGIGIDEDFIEHLFSPFERENDGAVEGVQGTGLGLAISKNLIEMMGGNINVKSKKGEGTEFSIDIVFKYSEETDAEYESDKAEESKADEEPLDLSKLKILLAEDNKVNRLIVRELLGEKVAVLDEAVNGKEAVETLLKQKPGYYSVILMDVQMPEMDGYEATRAIRSLENADFANIPIIAMTANAFEEDKHNAFTAGMNAHLAKPIDVDELMKTLKSVL